MSVHDIELDDERVIFIADYVIKNLKIRPDRFEKYYTLEENKKVFKDFFDRPNIPSLIIIQSGSTISAQYEFPSNPKTKSCYFIRRAAEFITKETSMRKFLLYGDLSYVPLDHLSGMVKEVFTI